MQNLRALVSCAAMAEKVSQMRSCSARAARRSLFRSAATAVSAAAASARFSGAARTRNTPRRTWAGLTYKLVLFFLIERRMTKGTAKLEAGVWVVHKRNALLSCCMEECEVFWGTCVKGDIRQAVMYACCQGFKARARDHLIRAALANGRRGCTVPCDLQSIVPLGWRVSHRLFVQSEPWNYA